MFHLHSCPTHCRSYLRPKGFTAIEILLTVGVIAVTAGLTIPMFRQYQMSADLDTSTEHLVQALRGAATLSQTGKQDSAWGVYFPDGTLFAGDAYAERNPDFDVTLPLAPTIETSGLTEVVFSRLDGLPKTTGSVFVTSTVTNAYREIIIDANGVIRVSDVRRDTPPVVPDTSSSDTSDSSASSSAEGGDGSSQGSSTSSSADNSAGSSTTSSSAGSTGDSSVGSSSSSGGDGSSSSSGQTGTSSSSSGGDGGSSSSSSASDGTIGDDPSCDLRFSVASDEVKTVGTNDVKIKVLGSEITYGAGGPSIPVRVSVSTNGGKAWNDLFNGRAIEAGDLQTLANLPSNTSIRLRFNGRYSWLFNKTFTSNARDGHTVILRNGDTPPDYAPFANQQSLATFLRPYISAQGKVTIGPKDLLILEELGTLDRNADFQDAVVLVTFAEKATTCTDSGKQKVKLHFNRLENSGSGNASDIVYVGPQRLAFAEDQWIPLVDRDGTQIIDDGMVEDVPGIALERGNGVVHIVSHGSHPDSSGKEIVDMKVEFNKAYISAVGNDSGGNVTENAGDSVIDDTADGDEFMSGPNAKSMFFYTRVTTDDDGVYLTWKPGEPSDAVSSSASDTSSSSSSTSSTVATDPCAAPFSVATNGAITLGSASDVTVRVLGAQGTYGRRGPRLMVTAKLSVNGGTTWQSLFGGKSLRGNELSVFRNLPTGSRILLSFVGRYSWVFNKSVESGRGDKHVRILKNGETFAGLYEITARGDMKAFLRNILDRYGRVKIGSREVAVLTEFDDTSSADFQDAVVIVSVDKAGGCVSSSASSASTTSSSVSSSSGTSSSVGSSASSSSSSVAANVDSDNDGIMNSDDWCPYSTTIPESVPTEQFTTGRYALTSPRGNPHSIPVFRVGPRNKVGSYTLQDTKGCSCSQILDAIDDVGNHRFDEHPVLWRQMQNLFGFYVTESRKFGCSNSLMRMVMNGQ